MRALTVSLLLLSACAKPAAQRAMRTTDGAIAVQNLESRIAALEASRARGGPQAGSRALALSDLYQTRAQYLGTLLDYDKALEAASSAVRLRPLDGSAQLQLASVLAGLHRFDESLAAIDVAEKLGEGGARADGLRASILQARGQLDEALTLRERAAALHATLQSLAGVALVHAARRDQPKAEAAFAAAVASYRDTSPFPLAWLDFQRALADEREGRLDAARARYQAALERLPAFAQAAAHLAALEALQGPAGRTRSETRLRSLIARSDDPEYLGQLAALVEARANGDAGLSAEAVALRDRAARGYEALLARHPLAFADHAARFFLASDPRRALALAELNFGNRPTAEALDLALSAAQAARDSAAACSLADRARQVPAADPRQPLVAARARLACAATADRRVTR